MPSTDRGFRLDPAFEDGSVFAFDGPLSQVRIQDDARFPWLILIPRRVGLTELEDLSADQRRMLMDEIIDAGARVRAMGFASGRTVEKLNVAAIGNVTGQLHVHVVGRRVDDGLWPEPVWGRGPTEHYGRERLDALLAVVRARG